MKTTSSSSRTSTVGMLLPLALALLGCSHAATQPPPQSAQRLPSAPPPVARSAPPAAPSGERCSLPAMYFAYDSALLDEASRDGAVAAVSCYSRHGMPDGLTLEGATDPRGTEEYNLALGQRRASAVQHLLVTLGVAPARIAATSSGEERAVGRDEAGWRLDRHVVATEH